MEAFFVQLGIDVKDSIITEWAYVFIEGITFANRMPSTQIMYAVMVKRRKGTMMSPWITNCRDT
jgi:hypothetical protein